VETDFAAPASPDGKNTTMSADRFTPSNIWRWPQATGKNGRRREIIRQDRPFNEKLRVWENYYNYQRPHGALGGQPPYERLVEERELECQAVRT
jgi:transposase InsO family protein